MTSETHHVYLSLGSNLEPETHLRQAIQMLKQAGELRAISAAWENHAVGAHEAPNFLNACVELFTSLGAAEFKEQVIQPVENSLGRERNDDKYSPRPIDIDMILFDNQPMRLEYWNQAFMVVPLAELIPQFIDPLTGKPLAQVAHEALQRQWMLARPEVLSRT